MYKIDLFLGKISMCKRVEHPKKMASDSRAAEIWEKKNYP